MDLRICLLALTALILAMLIKQWRADLLPLVRLSVILVFAFLLISSATPLIGYLRSLMNASTAGKYTEPMLKALGVAVLTQFCSEICKECGESGIATGVETAGKLEIMLLCLPLIHDLLKIASELMSLGI